MIRNKCFETWKRIWDQGNLLSNIFECNKSFVRSNIDWYVSQKYNYVLLKVRLDIHTDNKTCSYYNDIYTSHFLSDGYITLS